MESEESVTLVEKNVLDERKWEEIREQAIKSLEGYKKKEVQKEERLDRRELNIKKGTKKWSK